MGDENNDQINIDLRNRIEKIEKTLVELNKKFIFLIDGLDELKHKIERLEERKKNKSVMYNFLG